MSTNLEPASTPSHLNTRRTFFPPQCELKCLRQNKFTSISNDASEYGVLIYITFIPEDEEPSFRSTRLAKKVQQYLIGKVEKE